MRPDQRRRILLGLIGPDPSTVTARLPGDSDWPHIAAMAAQHRLEPWLHARLADTAAPLAIPAYVRQRWRASYRASAMRALALRKSLLDTVALLAAEGIAAAALKGAWAAWHAYGAPAQRPMRDIDLLLCEDRALQAFALLIAHGYRQEEPSARTPGQSLHRDKHLPPLLAPDGTRVELHMRLWERSDAIGWPMPPDESAAMLARAAPCGTDPVPYLCAEDRMVHTVIHGAYSNRLNGGPLVLLDIAAMAQREEIDWPQFWQRAEHGKWERGAALLVHLADAYCCPGLSKTTGCPIAIAPQVRAGAPDLLLQDLDARKTLGLVSAVAGTMHQAGLAAAAAAALERLRGHGRGLYTAGGQGGPGESFARWSARRLRETARALSDSDLRQAMRGTSRLGQWLDDRH